MRSKTYIVLSKRRTPSGMVTDQSYCKTFEEAQIEAEKLAVNNHIIQVLITALLYEVMKPSGIKWEAYEADYK